MTPKFMNDITSLLLKAAETKTVELPLWFIIIVLILAIKGLLR